MEEAPSWVKDVCDMEFLLGCVVGLPVGWFVIRLVLWLRRPRAEVRTFQIYPKTDQTLHEVLNGFVGRVFAGQLVTYLGVIPLKENQGFQYIIRTVPHSGEQQVVVERL